MKCLVWRGLTNIRDVCQTEAHVSDCSTAAIDSLHPEPCTRDRFSKSGDVRLMVHGVRTQVPDIQTSVETQVVQSN